MFVHLEGGVRVYDLGFRVRGFGFRVQGSEFSFNTHIYYIDTYFT